MDRFHRRRRYCAPQTRVRMVTTHKEDLAQAQEEWQSRWSEIASVLGHFGVFAATMYGAAHFLNVDTLLLAIGWLALCVRLPIDDDWDYMALPAWAHFLVFALVAAAAFGYFRTLAGPWSTVYVTACLGMLVPWAKEEWASRVPRKECEPS